MRHFIRLFFLTVFLFSQVNVFAQSVGIGSTQFTPDAQSILDIRSTTKGVLLSRMTTAQRTAIAPLNNTDSGLTVYDTDTDSYWFWDGAAWQEIPTVSGSGNTLDQAYDEGGNGVGRTITADNGAVNIAGPDGLTVNGNVGIGVTGPGTALDVRGFATFGNAFTPTSTEYENIINIIAGNNTDGASNGIAFYESTNGFGMKIGYDGSGTGPGNALRFYNDSDGPIMTLLNGGNLGIGLDDPLQRLHVSGTTRISTLSGTGDQVVYADADGDLTRSTVNVNNLIEGSGTTNYLAKWTPDGTTLGTSVVYDDGTYVGVGTTSPTQRLQVEVNENSGINLPVLVRNRGGVNSGGTGSGIGFNADNASPTYAKNALYFERNSDFSRGKFHILMNNAANTTAASLADSRLTILSNGRVGIGETAPTAQLSLGDWNSGSAGTTSGEQLSIGGTHNTGVNSGGKKLYINGHDNDGAVVYPIYVEDENGTIDMWLRNRPTAAGKVTMFVDGNLGLAENNPQQRLHVDGTGRFSDLSAGPVYATANGDLTSTAPTTGTLGYWQRNGTDLAPANLGDEVGIGIAAPLNTLHVEDAPGSSFTTSLRLSGSNTAVGGGNAIFFKTSTNNTADRYGVKLGAVRSSANNGAAEFIIQMERTGLSGMEDVFRINDVGNVGIGLTDPAAALHVEGTTNPLLTLHNTDNGTGSAIQFSDNGSGAQRGTLEYRHTDTQSFGAGESFHLFGTESALNFFVDGSMLVGNNFAPTATEGENIINVLAGSNGSGASNGIAFYESDNGYGMKLGYDGTGAGDANALRFYDDGDASLVTIQNGGNVGVGVDDPFSKLTVRGTTGGDGTWTEGILVENTAGSAGEPAVAFKNSSTGSNYWHTGLNQSEQYDISYGTSYTNANTKVRIQTDGNVGIGTVGPSEKLDVDGNAHFTGAIVSQGFATAEITIEQNTNLNGPDNSYHTVTCPNGYAMMNLGIYASSRLDGGERINCVKMSDIVTASHTWRGRGGGSTSSGSSTNTFSTGADNQEHSCSCASGEVATGFQVYSAGDHLDGYMKVRCSQLRAGYVLANNGTTTVNGYSVRGVMSVNSTPWGNGQDDQYHVSTCPTGTFVTAVAIYASGRLDGRLRCYCSGIKQ